MAYSQQFDVAIIGGGIAGLSVALRLPANMHVALFTKGQLGESNTRYAQGGLAVALGADDSSELHFQDTLVAGAGLCNEDAVRVLVERGPAAVHWLIEMGVQFDRAQAETDSHATPDGLLLGREAAHSRWRVIHAGGDATGAEIERALTATLPERPSISVFAETYVHELVVQGGSCVGVRAIDKNGQRFTLSTRAVVLANGGAGGLWLHTSNPSGATADGVALAWRAGAALTDLEFMQFHPTVLVTHSTSHLISEAVRGEGAYLRNHAGERFMPRYSELAELAPRDVVARAILSEMLTEGTDCQYLDLSHLPAEKIHTRFPTISAICCQNGFDLASDPLPVAPAAHYCMGGIMVDTYGRTTLPGLYAVGEVACTGVHGANRLASNSLLEGLVYGLRVAEALQGQQMPQNWCFTQSSLSLVPYTMPSYIMSSAVPDEHTIDQVRQTLRSIMWEYVSLCRDYDGLLEARCKIQSLRRSLPTDNVMSEVISPYVAETVNMLLVAELVIAAALERRESRGSHWRSDYQSLVASLAGHHYVFQRTEVNACGLERLRDEVVPYA